MNAIRLPIETEQRLETLAQKTGRAPSDLVNEAIIALSKELAGAAPSASNSRVAAHDRLMERLEKGWDFGGDRFDRDSLYDR